MSSASAPESFFCPVTYELMRDPVTACDGHSYERVAIEQWLRTHDTSPKTGAQLRSRELLPNHSLRNSIEEWELANCKLIPRSALTLHKQIGAGSFKVVYRASLRRPGSPRDVTVAAMKVRSGDVAAEAEALLKVGRHPRLVTFIGQCKDSEDPAADLLLLTEFAPMGSLDAALERLEEEGDELSLAHKLAIMQQVVAAMEALVGLKLVHRDLALRNVLVFALDVDDVRSTSVKVADFGLTVNLYTATCRYVQGGAMLVQCEPR